MTVALFSANIGGLLEMAMVQLPLILPRRGKAGAVKGLRVFFLPGLGVNLIFLSMPDPK